MKIVIQCASKKSNEAGSLRDINDAPVLFVANPELAYESVTTKYVRPDDLRSDGSTWRQHLLEYNRNGENPYNLLPAAKLYHNSAYTQLVSEFGIENVYILSAGWGLLRADFLTPKYDITFSAAAEKYKKRTTKAQNNDFCQLMPHPDDVLVFFGGKDYLPMFCSITESLNVKRLIFYNSKIVPSRAGCHFRRFETKTRTNWHYECVKALLDGKLNLSV